MVERCLFVMDAVDPRACGGKHAGLLRLRAMGLTVPPFFTIAPADVEAVASGARADVLAAALRHLGPGPFAVRSSGLDEDGARVSFAGQHTSVLGASTVDEVTAAVGICARSFHGAAAQRYRAAHGLPAARVGGVVVQQLVDAQCAGVAFSVDPLTRADVVLISACLGFGEGVVADRAPADTFRVDARGAIGAEVTRKDARILRVGARLEQVAVSGAQATAAALDDATVQQLARDVRALAAACGHAVDVEWVWTPQAGLAYVQCRPLTGQAVAAEPARAARFLFETSNIAESYPGVTSPLTYSHIRAAYSVAYQESARLCGVPEGEIAAHARAFTTLLARINGRVHYHLPSWFAVLALYPGYNNTRAFMLEMMGAEALATDVEALVPKQPQRAWPVRVQSAVRLLRTFLGRNRLVRAFHARLRTTLVPLEQRDWASVPAEDVVDELNTVRETLLRGWQAPLVADFLAMLAFGALQALCKKRGVADGVLADLFAGAELDSAAPARALMALARTLQHDAPAARAFCAAPPQRAHQLLRAHVEAGPAFAAFLAHYGARAMHELKLEQPTWADDPLFVVRQLQDLVRAGVASAPVDARARRRTAEREARAHLRGAERFAFAVLVRAARTWTGHREAMRYARARTFAVLRQIALRLGDALVHSGHLDSRRDVFFLEWAELAGVFDGTATTYDLRSLVALRAAEDARSAALPPQPDRLIYDAGVILGPPRGAVAALPAQALTGVCVVRGRVQGPVKIVRCADDAVDVPGHILVCPRTDPGYAVLFPAARALLVERGSPLSHCAIVARELGLPTLVNVHGVMDALRDGDLVEVDATAGTVVRLAREHAVAA